MTKTFSTWLSRIGKDESFVAEPKLKNIFDQTLILDRDVVIQRIIQEIRAGGLIICFGDYDVDGSTAAVILADTIRQLGGRVQIQLASRFSGGYGLSDAAVDKILQQPVKLLVTLDCGGSDHPRIRRINEQGIDVLVIDHHVTPKEKLPALGFINPHQPDCRSTYKWFCSGGLAWSVAGGLKKALNSDIDVMSYLDLVALSTIADVAPLDGDNRTLVYWGLKALAKSNRPGVKALLRLAKIQPGAVLTGRDVAFRLAPLINAPGRLTDPQVIANLLLSRTDEEADQYAVIVEDLTAKRRLITDTLTCESVKQVTEAGFEGQSALVLGDPSWNHGIVGIVAARIVEKYNVPVCVVGSGGHGSLRGPPGSRLHDALITCSSHLLKYGGHQAAAGCTIQFDHLENFRQTFCSFFAANPPVPLQNSFSEVLELDLSDNCLKLIEELATLEPCGQGNPRPKIQVEGKAKGAKSVKGDHLKLDVILTDSRTIGCFAIGKGALADEVNGKNLRVIGDLRKNEWMGKVKAEIFADSLEIVG